MTHYVTKNSKDLTNSINNNSDGTQIRTLKKDNKKNMNFIHWWFYPSSYNEWVPSNLVNGDDDIDDDYDVDIWKVGEQFIIDLDKFNEWMVEYDYEIEDDNENENEIENENEYHE
eukprot:CAMPEP_0114695122 /NCGR_PEP_ID=MMETSP0191-20121206/71007_1 /TAXON_ID=126664 /ORGANISM="Sorites sp." /LENGTH=114 /DNA_ID=CAMNT_0001990979 /DNA_START=66 /DNA_END=413 /DNA_ORIENTATION=+